VSSHRSASGSYNTIGSPSSRVAHAPPTEAKSALRRKGGVIGAPVLSKTRTSLFVICT
jgi:hypothetical protein